MTRPLLTASLLALALVHHATAQEPAPQSPDPVAALCDHLAAHAADMPDVSPEQCRTDLAKLREVSGEAVFAAASTCVIALPQVSPQQLDACFRQARADTTSPKDGLSADARRAAMNAQFDPDAVALCDHISKYQQALDANDTAACVVGLTDLLGRMGDEARADLKTCIIGKTPLTDADASACFDAAHAGLPPEPGRFPTDDPTTQGQIAAVCDHLKAHAADYSDTEAAGCADGIRDLFGDVPPPLRAGFVSCVTQLKPIAMEQFGACLEPVFKHEDAHPPVDPMPDAPITPAVADFCEHLVAHATDMPPGAKDQCAPEIASLAAAVSPEIFKAFSDCVTAQDTLTSAALDVCAQRSGLDAALDAAAPKDTMPADRDHPNYQHHDHEH